MTRLEILVLTVHQQQVQYRVYPRLAAADDQILLLVAPHPGQSWGYSPLKVKGTTLFDHNGIYLPFIGIKLTPGATLKPGADVAGTIVSQQVASTNFFL